MQRLAIAPGSFQQARPLHKFCAFLGHFGRCDRTKRTAVDPQLHALHAKQVNITLELYFLLKIYK